MNGLLETVEVFTDVSATGADHALDLFMLAETLYDERGLHGELTGRNEHKSLDLV